MSPKVDLSRATKESPVLQQQNYALDNNVISNGANISNVVCFQTRSSGSIAVYNKNFHTFDVPGDGQCFFHALSLGINGNFPQTQFYRYMACSEM